jgi:hypothetical protein
MVADLYGSATRQPQAPLFRRKQNDDYCTNGSTRKKCLVIHPLRNICTNFNHSSYKKIVIIVYFYYNIIYYIM